jgi:hypothetical protein
MCQYRSTKMTPNFVHPDGPKQLWPSALFTALTTLLEIYNQNKRHKSGWWRAREHIILKTQLVRERARGVVPVHLNGNQPVSHIYHAAPRMIYQTGECTTRIMLLIINALGARHVQFVLLGGGEPLLKMHKLAACCCSK